MYRSFLIRIQAFPLFWALRMAHDQDLPLKLKSADTAASGNRRCLKI